MTFPSIFRPDKYVINGNKLCFGGSGGGSCRKKGGNAICTLMLPLKSVTSQVENGWTSRINLLAPSFPYANSRSMNLYSLTNEGAPNVLGTITSRQ